MNDQWHDESGERRVPVWRRYLRFRGRDVRADVADELEFHIEMIAERLIPSNRITLVYVPAKKTTPTTGDR